MMTELIDCPNCGTKLKNSLLSSVKLLSESNTKIINEYHDTKSTGYCTKCGTDLFSKYELKFIKERGVLSGKIEAIIDSIPVITIQSPLNWEYEILQMVTGQSTTGTGIISEFTSSFTDLFGMQSGRYNSKLKAGEDLCFALLRKQTIDMGGNAIIATDIDYSEVGGDKGMLMVCMSGTAIKLKNVNILGENTATKISELIRLNSRLKILLDYQMNSTS